MGDFTRGNVERDFFEMALYYRLPMASVKGAAYHLMARGKWDCYNL